MKKIPFLDLKTQYDSIKEEIDEAVNSVIKDSAFVGGKYVEKFENNFAVYTKRKHATGTANGTAALFMALKSAGIGKGDKVVVPAMTFVATSEAVTWSGADVIFSDVRKDDLLIDVEKIDTKKKLSGVIPVDLYGKMVAPDELTGVASDNGLKLIWDCCQSHGAKIVAGGKEYKSGQSGESACFSFYPGKNLGAYGDAGAVVTNSDSAESFIRSLCNHGREGKYNHSIEGFNERLDGMQAAILSVKLGYLDKWNEQRRRAAQTYKKRLDPLGVWTQSMSEGDLPVYHLFVIQHSKRDELAGELAEKGISTGIHYPSALHLLKAYKHLGLKEGDFPVAENAAKKILSLPIYPELSDNDIHRVCDEIEKFCSKNGL